MLNLKNLVRGYQSSARSAGELLPWMALWDNETVATHDQGLMAAFRYSGIDAEGKSQAEIDSAVNAFERGFAGFGSGSIVWSIVDRRLTKAYPGGRFTNPMAKAIDETWESQMLERQYENTYSLAVHQRSSDGTSALFDTMDRISKEEDVGLAMAFAKAAKSRFSLRANATLDIRRMEAAYEKLNARVSDLHHNLARLGLRRLGGEDLLAYLHMRGNPASGGRVRVPMPRTPAFLNFYLANDAIERHGNYIKFSDGVNTKYVGVVSLKGWPDGDSAPGMLDYLTAVDGEVSVAHVFRFIDRDVAKKAITGVEKYNITASVPFMHRMMSSFTKSEPTRFDEGRLALADDARAAAVELVGHNRAFGYHNMTVLCFGDSVEQMEHVRRQIMQRLSESFFMGFSEGMHQLTGWTQTLPGQWGASVRWSNVSFGNAADIAPIRTLWSGPTECKHFSTELKQGRQPALVSMPTDSGVPFNWDPFESGAGHTIFIGPTRSGKSVYVNFLLSQFQKYPGARVIRFDKDYSCKIATLSHDGVHIDLTDERGSKGARMSPIALVANGRHHPFLIRWVRQVIELGRPDAPLSPEEIETVTRAVQGLQELGREMHTLRHLRTSLGQSLGIYLQEWIGDGARGAWFDNEPSLVEIGDNVCFEMKRLFDDEQVAMLAMDYLFYLVEISLDGRPLIINSEETWFFLRNKQFVNRLDDFLRTIGKRNGALWMTTQGAQELVGDGQLLAMLEQLKNKVFLPNAEIMNNRDGYDKLGLTEGQLWRIQAAEPKRDYYIKTPSMTRMVQVRLPESLIPWLTASTRALTTFDRHFANRDQEGAWKLRYYQEMTGSLL